MFLPHLNYSWERVEQGWQPRRLSTCTVRPQTITIIPRWPRAPPPRTTTARGDRKVWGEGEEWVGAKEELRTRTTPHDLGPDLHATIAPNRRQAASVAHALLLRQHREGVGGPCYWVGAKSLCDDIWCKKGDARGSCYIHGGVVMTLTGHPPEHRGKP
jgi:hypothetical protein